MQDGTPPHKRGIVLDIINNEFGTRVITYQYPNRYFGVLHWPPYSPDMDPCVFYLWSHLKDFVYKKKPTDLLISLKSSVTNLFSSSKKEVRDLFIDSFVKLAIVSPLKVLMLNILFIKILFHIIFNLKKKFRVLFATSQELC